MIPAPILFSLDAFDVTARRNLEHAIARLELEASKLEHPSVRYAQGNRPLAIANQNAAATIRELLRLPEGSYAA